MLWFIAALWIACSILFCGFNFAYFQRTWPSYREAHYHADAYDSVKLSIFGPIALFPSIVLQQCSKGFLLPFTKQSKLEAGLM